MPAYFVLGPDLLSLDPFKHNSALRAQKIDQTNKRFCDQKFHIVHLRF